MSSIFLGLILIFFDVTFDVEGHIISFLPTFAGYISIAIGLRKIEKETKIEAKPRLCGITAGMCALMTIMYLMDLFGFRAMITQDGGTGGYIMLAILNVITALVEAYIIFGVIDYIRNVERKDNANLIAGTLYSTYQTVFIATLVTIVVAYIPGMEVVALVAMVCAFIAKLVFIIEFNKSKNLYYES